MKERISMKNQLLLGKDIGKGYFKANNGEIFISEGNSDGILTSQNTGEIYIIAKRDNNGAVIGIKPITDSNDYDIEV